MLQPSVISLLDQAAFGRKLRLLSAVDVALIVRGDAGVQWLTTAADRGFINYPYLAGTTRSWSRPATMRSSRVS
jgi:hypothetical protein